MADYLFATAPGQVPPGVYPGINLGAESITCPDIDGGGSGAITGVATIDGVPVGSLGAPSTAIWQPGTTQPVPYFANWTSLAAYVESVGGACTVYCDNSIEPDGLVVTTDCECSGKTIWIGLPLVVPGVGQQCAVTFAAGGSITDAYSFSFLSLTQTANSGSGGIVLGDDQVIQFLGCSLASVVDSVPLLSVVGSSEFNVVLCNNTNLPNTQFGTNGTVYVGPLATLQLILQNGSNLTIDALQYDVGATSVQIGYDSTSSIPAAPFTSPAIVSVESQSAAVYYDDASISPQLDVSDVQDAIDALKSTYLPLSGGTLTGAISFVASVGVDAIAAPLLLGTATAESVVIGSATINASIPGALAVSSIDAYVGAGPGAVPISIGTNPGATSEIDIGHAGVDTDINGRLVANGEIYSAANSIVVETGTVYCNNLDAVTGGDTVQIGETNAERVFIGSGGGVEVLVANSATDTLGFLGNAGIVRPTAATADGTAFAPGAGVPVDTDGTFTVAGGSNAYTVGQILQALVAYGLLAA